MNFGIGQITGYSLNQNISFILKVILYLTGIILFLTTIRPFKKLAIYYSLYALAGVLTGLFALFGGVFLAILSSLVIFPIVPKQTAYKTETIRIYDRYQGFMARCCSYEVVEPKLFMFEKHLGYINIERPIDGDKDEFTFNGNTVIYIYELDNAGQTTVRDTTEILTFD